MYTADLPPLISDLGNAVVDIAAKIGIVLIGLDCKLDCSLTDIIHIQ